ncbi:hypothetical protein PIIN_08726 [Serendipita indica DSM 11827]|uniref:DUF6593 domain-containing protein n=1 Tax=Serendipita indica (strain DSM 11827) TaxID=1109443 RepID=G4TTX5_SERID|nr:hypothetical protein PIIN_08726 [Serendipita indica DSM 11827]
MDCDDFGSSFESPSSSSRQSPRSSLDSFDEPWFEPTDYFRIDISSEDPTNASFTTETGKTLYRTVSFQEPIGSRPSTASSMKPPHITRVSRLYGNTARAAREAASKRRGGAGNGSSHATTSAAAEIGLMVAEMEWLEKTRSSRIRFGRRLGSPKHDVVDVRIDEFLKNTKGRGQSTMFAAADGRIFKWKANGNAPVELIQCERGRRVSTPLVTYQEANPEEGTAACLHVSTSLLSMIDQVIVSWVIMERDRRLYIDRKSTI